MNSSQDTMQKLNRWIESFSCATLLLLVSAPVMAEEGSTIELSKQCASLTERADRAFNDGLDTSKSESQQLRAHEIARAALEQSVEVCLEASKNSREPSEAAALAARGFINKGRYFEEQNQFDEALLAYSDGIDLVIGLDGDQSAALVELYEKTSDRLYQKMEYAEGRRFNQEALRLRRELYGAEDPSVIHGLMLMGVSYHPFRGETEEEKAAIGRDPKQAETFYREALKIALKDGTHLDEVVPPLSLLLRSEGRTGEADELLKLLN